MGFWQRRAPDGCSSHEKEDFDDASLRRRPGGPVLHGRAARRAAATTSPPRAPDGTTTETQTIEITFSGDTVEPNGERVEVKAGEEITLEVKADEPGELHVHSNPEQELPYGAGTTTLKLTIDEPGVVEVESHELEKVIVQLEVS